MKPAGGRYNVIDRKETKREQSEHLVSPDQSARNTEYSEMMKARSASHKMIDRKETKREQSEHFRE